MDGMFLIETTKKTSFQTSLVKFSSSWFNYDRSNQMRSCIDYKNFPPFGKTIARILDMLKILSLPQEHNIKAQIQDKCNTDLVWSTRNHYHPK